MNQSLWRILRDRVAKQLPQFESPLKQDDAIVEVINNWTNEELIIHISNALEMKS